LLQTHAPECRLAGIFISHCHIGHYTGLIHLGKEAWNTAKLPLIATPRVLDFLRTNGPWGQLFTNGNVEGVVLDDAPFELTDDATLSVMRVPHRGEYSDTVAYSIRSKQRSLFFCPDIDRWEEWDRDVRDVVAAHDVSLLDGSFFSGEELPGRDMSKIPHPIVTHTATVLKGVQRDVRFIHFNHTNPLLDEASPQRAWLRTQGFGMARQGETILV
jgi:pyrroloquinoline quinone biosynthesis protein B